MTIRVEFLLKVRSVTVKVINVTTLDLNVRRPSRRATLSSIPAPDSPALRDGAPATPISLCPPSCARTSSAVDVDSAHRDRSDRALAFVRREEGHRATPQPWRRPDPRPAAFSPRSAGRGSAHRCSAAARFSVAFASGRTPPRAPRVQTATSKLRTIFSYLTSPAPACHGVLLPAPARLPSIAKGCPVC